MEEKTARELIHKGFEDMRRWIDEAETYGQLGYRLGLVSEAISGRRMQYPWRSMEQVLPRGNEEWDMYDETRREKQ